MIDNEFFRYYESSWLYKNIVILIKRQKIQMAYQNQIAA